MKSLIDTMKSSDTMKSLFDTMKSLFDTMKSLFDTMKSLFNTMKLYTWDTMKSYFLFRDATKSFRSPSFTLA